MRPVLWLTHKMAFVSPLVEIGLQSCPSSVTHLITVLACYPHYHGGTVTIYGGSSWAKPLDKASDTDSLTELSPRPYEVSSIIIPILQGDRLRLRRVQETAQGFIAVSDRTQICVTQGMR